MISAATSLRDSACGIACGRRRIELARALAFVRQQLPDRTGHHARGERLLGDAEPREILLRQVDAALFQIRLDVANDVGDLQRQPEVERVVARARIAACRTPRCTSRRPPRRRAGNSRSIRRRCRTAIAADPSRRRRRDRRTAAATARTRSRSGLRLFACGVTGVPGPKRRPTSSRHFTTSVAASPDPAPHPPHRRPRGRNPTPRRWRGAAPPAGLGTSRKKTCLSPQQRSTRYH